MLDLSRQEVIFEQWTETVLEVLYGFLLSVEYLFIVFSWL